MLRKAPYPQTGPAAVTEIGPTIVQDVPAKKLLKEKSQPEVRERKDTLRSNIEKRGGRKLMGFLGTRFGSENLKRV